MFKRLVSLGAAALAALVGGCNGDGPSTVPGGYRNAATWSSFIHATSAGPLLLALDGNPFGPGASELAPVAVRAVEGALPARPFTTTSDPIRAADPRFRLHFVFAPVNELTERAICAGRAKGSVRAVGEGRVDVLAVFCTGDELLSSSRGWVAKLTGAQDRRFALLLGQLTRDVLADP